MNDASLLAAAKSGDRSAMQALVVANEGLIWAVARRFSDRAATAGTEADDLFQLAAIGFCKAVRDFDPTYQCRLSTYAFPRMLGEIRQFFRSDGMLKVGRADKEHALYFDRLRAQLSQELQREPTVSELAEAAGVSAEEVAALPQVVGRDELLSTLQTENLEEVQIEQLDLHSALQKLPPRTRQILQLRYCHGLPQQRIAPLYGVSQVQISRIERTALRTLRSLLD